MKEFISITSRDNSLIKLVSSLQDSAKARRENGLFVLEGLRICLDAFENGIQFDKLIVTENFAKKYSEEVDKFLSVSQNAYILSEQLFKKISDTLSPQGIIAVAKIPVSREDELDLNGRFIALENINDPSNLGAISRTAEALGASGIIISQNSCDPYSPKALRASMGTILRMRIMVPKDFVGFFKENGIKAYACVVDSNAENINDVEFCNGCAVIIGNEANGITTEMKNCADRLITIPMLGRAESLNAAVAASISIWEMMK